MSPTEKQIAFVEEITRTLGIEFPTCSKDFTKYTYSKFISAYITKYKETQNEIKNNFYDEEYCMEVCQNDVWCEYY